MSRELSPDQRARLELLLDVCDGVQHFDCRCACERCSHERTVDRARSPQVFQGGLVS